MNTPNNARSAQSKNKIKRAFTVLLEAHNVSDITVGDICKEAGVNRTTFYSHYSCIADLYKAIEEDMYVSIKEMLLPTDDISDERVAFNMIVTALEAIKQSPAVGSESVPAACLRECLPPSDPCR